MDRTTNDTLKFQIDKVEVILFFASFLVVISIRRAIYFLYDLLREMTYRLVGFFQVNVTQES